MKTKYFNTKAFARITIYLLTLLFFVFYVVYFLGYTGITFAATPTPSPPTVIDSPDPATNGQIVSVNCTGCSATGGTAKLFVCKDSGCSNCKGEMKNAPSNPTFAQLNGYETNPGNTLSEDNNWGYLRVSDASTSASGYARWIWDFGSIYTGIFKIKWLAKVTGDNVPFTCVDIAYGVYASNDCAIWTPLRTGTFQHGAGAGAWNPYTSTYFDMISGTYRCMKAEISSTVACIATAQLHVDVVRVDYESTSNCWCSFGYVASNPSCNAKTCGSCEYSVNNYWAMTGGKQTFGFDHYVYSSITVQQAFTCKKQDTCVCTSDTECYNNTCSPNGFCGTSPQIISISLSATLNQLAINWVTEFDRGDSVNVTCKLNNNENQKCQYSGSTGPGSCTIMSPQYDMTPAVGEPRTVENNVNCTVYYRADPRFYSESIKKFYPLSFKVSMPPTLSPVVGEKETLAITIKNNGTLSDGYTANVISADPKLLIIENGNQATQLLGTNDVQQIFVGVTLLSANTVNADATISSNTSRDYTEIKYSQTVAIKGKNKSLPDFGFFGILQIMFISIVVLVSFLS